CRTDRPRAGGLDRGGLQEPDGEQHREHQPPRDHTRHRRLERPAGDNGEARDPWRRRRPRARDGARLADRLARMASEQSLGGRKAAGRALAWVAAAAAAAALGVAAGHTLAAALFAIASAATAGTLFTKAGAFPLLDRFGLLPFAAFAVAPVVFRTARQRQILLVALVVLGAYLGATAVFELAGPKSLVYPRY